MLPFGIAEASPCTASTNMMAALTQLVCLLGKDLHEHAGTCEEVGRKICEDLPAWRLQ